jgi:hypothetical protein
MNKRAMQGPLWTTVLLAISIIFGILILVFLFGGEGILNKIAEASENFADKTLEKLRPTEYGKKEKVQPRQDIEQSYNSIIDVLKKSSEDNECLLRYDKNINNMNHYEIQISSTEEGTFIKILDPNKQIIAHDEIPDIKPCVVAGTPLNRKIPKNFYNRYLSKKSVMLLEPSFLEAETITIKESAFVSQAPRIIVNTKYSYEFEDKGLLFRADSSHICFFPTADGLWWCKAGKYTLDDNCLVEMNAGKHKAKLPFCK